MKNLQKFFWEQDRDFQREIALELSQKNHPLLKDFFLKVLKEHKDGKVIKCGLRFLGEKMKCEDAESEIIKFLDHPYDDVKEVALQAAISIGTESVKQEFMRMKKDEDPIKRFMAIYGFGSLGDKRFLADIKEAFCDEVEDVRKVAVEAYAQCADSDEEVLEVLSPMLEDGSRDVRLAVLDVLSHVKLRDKVRDLIIPLLKDKDDWVRIRAVEILGNIKEGVEPSILRPLLNSKNNLLRIKTLEALDNIGGEQVTRIFIDLLKTERDPEVQNTIERMLSKKNEDTLSMVFLTKTTTLRKDYKISDEEFKLLRDFIYNQTGIYIADNRKYLLETRLRNRLKELGLSSFSEYYYFLKYDPSRRKELEKLYSVVTTNETSFF